MSGVFETINLGMKRIGTNIGTGYKKNKPLVLIVLAGGCSLLAVAEAIKEGSKIKEGITETKAEFKNATTTKEKVVAVVDGVARLAGPVAKVAIPEIVAIGSMTESYKESSRRILAFATMAAGSQLELKDVRDSMREVVGQKKADQIEERAAQKQFERIGADEVVEYSDADQDNPDVIMDADTGCVWRDKYINTLDGIAAYFTKAKTGNEIFYSTSELYDLFDQYKNGNYIRRGRMCDEFGVMQADLKDIDNVQDFIKLVPAGPNRYKLIRQIKLRPNPDGWVDSQGKYFDSAGTDLYSVDLDDECGDGEWNGSLNPKNRA